jgi:hypothetical protein
MLSSFTTVCSSLLSEAWSLGKVGGAPAVVQWSRGWQPRVLHGRTMQFEAAPSTTIPSLAGLFRKTLLTIHLQLLSPLLRGHCASPRSFHGDGQTTLAVSRAA